MKITIEDCVDLFRWEIDLNKFKTIHDQYTDLLIKNFGYYLGLLKQNHPMKSSHLESLLSKLSKKAYMNLIAAPEFSYRIFYKYKNFEEVYHFIVDSTIAELLKEGQLKSHSKKVWTANGDYCYVPNTTKEKTLKYNSLKIVDTLSIDFISPYAMGDSVVFLHEKSLYTNINGPKYDSEEIKQIYSDLLNAIEIIYVTNPKLGEIVRCFTKSIIIRKDVKSMTDFSSASAGQYTGRTLLSNCHLDFVGHDILAEALVHESIHSIMYMMERETPWVKNKDLYFDQTIFIKSPWTNNLLRLRPFMQAAFVWYGILNFWEQVKKYNVLEESIANFYIQSAVKGYERKSLSQELDKWKNQIEPSVIEGINRIQDLVIKNYN